jgi:hypothetical protein
MGFPVQEVIDETRPQQSRTNRCSRDALLNDVQLRAFGFMIHARPSKGPTLWLKGGDVYTEAEALRVCKKLEKEA